jgi:hypothetical protein
MRQRWRSASPSVKASIAVGISSVVATQSSWNTDEQSSDRSTESHAQDSLGKLFNAMTDSRQFTHGASPFGSSIATVQCEGSSSFSASVMTRLSNIRKRRNTFKTMRDQAERETLESRFVVDWSNPIGEGSFGSVYVAEDRKTGEKVAIKKISKRATDDVSFQREMDALMHIRQHGGHPHICGLRANYDQGDYYYLVLDLVRYFFPRLDSLNACPRSCTHSHSIISLTQWWRNV